MCYNLATMQAIIKYNYINPPQPLQDPGSSSGAYDVPGEYYQNVHQLKTPGTKVDLLAETFPLPFDALCRLENYCCLAEIDVADLCAEYAGFHAALGENECARLGLFLVSKLLKFTVYEKKGVSLFEAFEDYKMSELFMENCGSFSDFLESYTKKPIFEALKCAYASSIDYLPRGFKEKIEEALRAGPTDLSEFYALLKAFPGVSPMTLVNLQREGRTPSLLKALHTRDPDFPPFPLVFQEMEGYAKCAPHIDSKLMYVAYEIMGDRIENAFEMLEDIEPSKMESLLASFTLGCMNGELCTLMNTYGYPLDALVELRKNELLKKMHDFRIPYEMVKDCLPEFIAFLGSEKCDQRARLFFALKPDFSLLNKSIAIPYGIWESYVVRIEGWGDGYNAIDRQQAYGDLMHRAVMLTAEAIKRKLPFSAVLDFAAYQRFKIAETLGHEGAEKFGLRLTPDDIPIVTPCVNRYAFLADELLKAPFEPLSCVQSELSPPTTQKLAKRNRTWKILKMRYEESYQELIVADSIGTFYHSAPSQIAAMEKRGENAFKEAFAAKEEGSIFSHNGEVFWCICTGKFWHRADPSIAEIVTKASLALQGYTNLRWKKGKIPWAEVILTPTPQQFGAKFRTLLEILA